MLVLGGGMANTFLLAQGKAIGKSLAEPDRVEDARRILATAARQRRPRRPAGRRHRGQGGHPRDRVQDAAGREDPRLVAHRRPRQGEPGPDGRGAVRRPDRVLERAAGRLRDPVVRPRDEGGRADAGRARRRRRHGRRRWRRFGRGGHPAGPGRPDDPHLDRWRRVARVPRGSRAARRDGPARSPGRGPEGKGEVDFEEGAGGREGQGAREGDRQGDDQREGDASDAPKATAGATSKAPTTAKAPAKATTSREGDRQATHTEGDDDPARRDEARPQASKAPAAAKPKAKARA